MIIHIFQTQSDYQFSPTIKTQLLFGMKVPPTCFIKPQSGYCWYRLELVCVYMRLLFVQHANGGLPSQQSKQVYMGFHRVLRQELWCIDYEMDTATGTVYSYGNNLIQITYIACLFCGHLRYHLMLCFDLLGPGSNVCNFKCAILISMA